MVRTKISMAGGWGVGESTFDGTAVSPLEGEEIYNKSVGLLR